MKPKTPELVSYTATYSAGPVCKHQNGFYFTAHFWIFEKRYFMCAECWQGIPIKTYKKIREIYDAH